MVISGPELGRRDDKAAQRRGKRRVSRKHAPSPFCQPANRGFFVAAQARQLRLTGFRASVKAWRPVGRSGENHLADIVLITPKFETSYWGMEHALELVGFRANMPVAALPLLAALTPA
jgi:hypothetical protein